MRALEKGDGGIEDFLGEFPLLSPEESQAVSFYWETLRAGTPADHPVDRGKALDLWERLYGEADARRLFQAVSVMEGVYAKSLRDRRDEEIQAAERRARSSGSRPPPISRG